MSTAQLQPWPDRPMADRSLRVAMTGYVHDDDPTIIADMQERIDDLAAAIRQLQSALQRIANGECRTCGRVATNRMVWCDDARGFCVWQPARAEELAAQALLTLSSEESAGAPLRARQQLSTGQSGE